MLNWSPGAVKATVGVGGLGILMLSIASLDKLLHIGFGVAFTIALLPALIFVFAVPDLLPTKVVRISQWIAIAWYFLCAVLSLAVAIHRGFTRIEAFFLCFVLVGAWPCLLATHRLRTNAVDPPMNAGTSSADSSENRNTQHLVPVHVGTDVTFRASRKKALLLFLGSICFVAIGVWMSSERPLIGWGSVVFFGLGVPVSLLMLLPEAMYLRLDAEGFEIGSFLGKNRTKWDDVARFEIGSIRNTKMIAIVYARGYQGQQVGRAIASSLAGMEGAIRNSYDAPLGEILASLNAWKSRFSRTET
jgi:hypothetical protein